MFRLTRQVRFSINDNPDGQLQGKPSNSYGGFPSLNGPGRYFAADVTIAGELDPQSQYLMNIKSIDEAVREALPDVEMAVRKGSASPAELVKLLFDRMKKRWPDKVEAVTLWPTPFLSFEIRTAEVPMMRLSQKFEFSASHRLHNPAMSDEDNRRTFGKCNNPSGHGHNYEVQVTLVGKPNESGVLIDIPAFERTVAQTVIEPLDHKHLNSEVTQFRSLIPSVENIAKVIYEMLAPKLKSENAKLASVTVWETPKTWCEYAL
jgi:6-pyruvoyltetrahydropterin/6-carboxytetrahydropterin synthase